MKTTLRTLASLFVLCCLTAGAYAINPLKEYTYTPKDLGLEYSEDSVMTSDGYRIHIWNLPGKEGNDRSVLIAYADAGNMGQWLSVGVTLNLLGYDLWMFDAGEHLRQYPGNKSLIRSCIMDGFVTDPSKTVRILTADTRVTLKEFDCRHLQAAFTHTEDYFTAIDAFLKAH